MAGLKGDEEFKKQLGPNARNFLMEASKKWNSLTAEEKAKYQDMAQVYKEQLLQKNEDMDEEDKGNEDEEASLKSISNYYINIREVHVIANEQGATDNIEARRVLANEQAGTVAAH